MINLKTGDHFRDATKKEIRPNVCTSQCRNMTRGGFLKGILASGIAPSITLGAMSLAGSANATVGSGMMRNVGARNAAMFGGGWKNPYITDGLIAMWDGEWNAGGGKHDENATVWKDCVSGFNSINNLLTYGAWTDNSFDHNNTTGFKLIDPFIGGTINEATWEAVITSYYSSNDTCLIYMYNKPNNAIILRHDYSSVSGGRSRIGWRFNDQMTGVINQNQVGNYDPILFSMSGRFNPASH